MHLDIPHIGNPKIGKVILDLFVVSQQERKIPLQRLSRTEATSQAQKMVGRLEGRVAIVTGASSGLGRAISQRYASEGAKVVCSDLRAEPPNETDGAATHEAIVKNGGQAIFVKTDVGESSEMEALIAAAVEKFGRLDM